MTNLSYQKFIESKYLKSNKSGFEVDKNKLNNILFDYQKDLVFWALKQGKSAIFADTGLGKTFMQLEGLLTFGRILMILFLLHLWV